MRIQGTFLRGRVSRRLYWSLLAAALLPMLAFGVLGYRALDSQLRTQAQRVDEEHAKHVGMRVYDRLVAAQAALSVYARAGDWTRPAAPDAPSGPVLRAVATVDASLAHAGGHAPLTETWRSVLPASPVEPRRSLWWRPAQGGQEARVIVGQRDPAGRGWWLAEVAPEFVWSDFLAEGVGADVCVTADEQRPLRCAHVGATPAASPAWSLFLDGGFGSPDWRFEVRRDPAGAAEPGPIGPWAAQAALATLLLIAALSLTQVRRIMVPLERLSAATQRLARGDWRTRVDLPDTDEFGQLAASLNVMAARIENQLQSLEVNAAIDRAILDGVDVPFAMGRAVQRLEVLVPRARAAVAARGVDGAPWRAFRASGEAVALEAPDAAGWRCAADGMATPFDPRGPSAAWARRALNLAEGDGRSIRAIFAPMPSAPTALLLVAVPRSAEMSADLLREVAELRDRVSVTLAAAEREGRLLARALRDGLTGLLNRDGLQERAAALLSGDGDPRASTLMFIDLDGFKEVNDAHGHLAGDELLVAVADRLHGLAPTGTPLARPGGDEFVLLLPGDAAPAEALAERICTRLAEPFLLREQQVRVGASVGLAVCPDDGRDLLQLMRRADMAMYAAKASGRGVWRRYHEALDEQAAERAWIVRDLHTALEAGGQLTLHYQPRVDARSGTMRSAEALVRWRHPIRGAIAPARFIGIAEDAGLIERLGQQVLTQALQQLRRWRDAGVPVARVSVNVSALQLRDDRFTASVLRQLDRLGLAADGLELEITESLFMRDIDAVCARLAPMRERGVVIALDDFGTGYSSMAALHQLPVDVLKIDRSFVADLGQRATADAVVRSVLLLARALGKRVVAEGVETPTQRAHLTELGCDELQGYLFSRPVPAADLEAWAQRGVVGRVAAPA